MQRLLAFTSVCVGVVAELHSTVHADDEVSLIQTAVTLGDGKKQGVQEAVHADVEESLIQPDYSRCWPYQDMSLPGRRECPSNFPWCNSGFPGCYATADRECVVPAIIPNDVNSGKCTPSTRIQAGSYKCDGNIGLGSAYSKDAKSVNCCYAGKPGCSPTWISQGSDHFPACMTDDQWPRRVTQSDYDMKCKCQSHGKCQLP